MKIKALVPFSTGTISMEQNEVKDVEDTLGEQLISAGVAVEIGGGSGGGVLVVTATAGTLNKTWQEIVDAMSTTGAVLAHYVDGSIDILKTFQHASTDGESYYEVKTGTGALNTYEATSASGYPVQQT